MDYIPIKRIAQKDLDRGKGWKRAEASYKKGRIFDQNEGLNGGLGSCTGCVAANVWEIMTGEMESGKQIYLSARLHEKATSENYDKHKPGTSMAASFSALARRHNIDESAHLVKFRNFDEVMSWLVGSGPVAFGGYWTQGMVKPKGFWKKRLIDSGEIYGGHASTIIGTHSRGDLKIENSWGRTWGMKGAAYMSWEDFDNFMKKSNKHVAYGFKIL